MTFNEFIKPIDELATKYGFEKNPVDPNVNTHFYYIPVGKTQVQFYFYEVFNANYVLAGCIRGLQEYISIRGSHIVSKCDEQVSYYKFEDLDLDMLENWMKAQNEVVARHNQYLKNKEVKNKLKKAKTDFE